MKPSNHFILNTLKTLIVFHVSMAMAASEQNTNGELTSLKKPWQVNGQYCFLQINPAEDTESTKKGNSLGLTLQYGFNYEQGELGLGYGFRYISATGDKSNLHQDFSLITSYFDISYRRTFFDEHLSAGPWVQMAFGKGALLKYNEPESIQLAPYFGGQIHYGGLGQNGQWSVTSGMLYQPTINKISNWMIPIQIGYSFDGDIVKNVDSSLTDSGSPSQKAEQVKTEILLGSQILVFEVGVETLRGNASEYINDISKVLKDHPELWNELKLVGYSSEIEEGALAAKRAERVKQAFADAGLPVQKLNFEANKNNTSNTFSPQRVDIIVTTTATGFAAIDNYLNPIKQKWDNLTYRFRDPSLFFQVGKDQLTPEAKKLLTTIAFELKKDLSSWQKIVIYGFTDSSGNPKSNIILAKKRAKAAAQIFRDKGIEAQRIDPIGMTSMPDQSKVGKDNSEDRRVEVEVLGITQREKIQNLFQAVKK